jgi:hypothetical protein
MNFKIIIIFCCWFGMVNSLFAQQITGNWQGKIGTGLKNKKLELKLVLKGDSIVGTSYYYESKSNYKRYNVKGYFNPKTNAVIWWDDQLIESRQPKVKVFAIPEMPYLMEADFNCPGGGIMMLDGNAKATEKNNKEKIHLDKKKDAIFEDEWNLVIDNWLLGGNDIALIDSIQHIAFNKSEYEKVTPIVEVKNPTDIRNENVKQNNTTTAFKGPIEATGIYKKDTIKNEVVLDLPVKKEMPTIGEEKPKATKPPMDFLDLNKPNKKDIAKLDTTNKSNDQLELQEGWSGGNGTAGVLFDNFSIDSKKNEKPTITFENIEKPKKKVDTIVAIKSNPIVDKFVERKKIILAELPLADSMELHFYDNAEVDGDSISLFLNNQLLLQHIRLTDKPYIVKLNKEQLQTAIELTMVAENLGAIPPNTSYMVATINGKQYTATLSSTEQTSAVIRFKKE